MKRTKNPIFEQIEPNIGSSFLYKSFDEQHPNNYESVWHYHPELEIVYVNTGSGKRQIGSHLSHYRNGDLILIGSNLPHCGITGLLTDQQRETVIQWNHSAFGATFWDLPEMESVRILFKRALGGIVFHGDDKRAIGTKIEAIKEKTGLERMLGLLEVFNMMAATENYTILNAAGYMLETKMEDNDRINRVFNFVKEAYQDQINLDDVSKLINMTPSSFCKYFKKITRKTFIQFVTEYRLIHAAKLLHESNLGVNDICYECGFNNYSHFTKKFKTMMGKTPLHYRNELKFNLMDATDI